MRPGVREHAPQRPTMHLRMLQPPAGLVQNNGYGSRTRCLLRQTGRSHWEAPHLRFAHSVKVEWDCMHVLLARGPAAAGHRGRADHRSGGYRENLPTIAAQEGNEAVIDWEVTRSEERHPSGLDMTTSQFLPMGGCSSVTKPAER